MAPRGGGGRRSADASRPGRGRGRGSAGGAGGKWSKVRARSSSDGERKTLAKVPRRGGRGGRSASVGDANSGAARARAGSGGVARGKMKGRSKQNEPPQRGRGSRGGSRGGGRGAASGSESLRRQGDSSSVRMRNARRFDDSCWDASHGGCSGGVGDTNVGRGAAAGRRERPHWQRGGAPTVTAVACDGDDVSVGSGIGDGCGGGSSGSNAGADSRGNTGRFSASVSERRLQQRPSLEASVLRTAQAFAGCAACRSVRDGRLTTIAHSCGGPFHIAADRDGANMIISSSEDESAVRRQRRARRLGVADTGDEEGGEEEIDVEGEEEEREDVGEEEELDENGLPIGCGTRGRRRRTGPLGVPPATCPFGPHCDRQAVSLFCRVCGQPSHAECAEGGESRNWDNEVQGGMEGFVCPFCRLLQMDPLAPPARRPPGMPQVEDGLLTAPTVLDPGEERASLSFRALPLKWGRRRRVQIRAVALEPPPAHGGWGVWGPRWPPALNCLVNGKAAFEIARKLHGHVRKEVIQDVSHLVKAGLNRVDMWAEWDKPEDVVGRVRSFLICAVIVDPATDEDLCREHGLLIRPREEGPADANPEASAEPQTPWTWGEAILSTAAGKERVVQILHAQSKEDEDDVELLDDGSPLAGRVMKLSCPLTVCRIKTAAVGRWCRHVQCFDLSAYLATARRQTSMASRWTCPVCARPTLPVDLTLDPYAQAILEDSTWAEGNRVSDEDAAVKFDMDGSWEVVTKQQNESGSSRVATAEDGECSDTEETAAPQAAPPPTSENLVELSSDSGGSFSEEERRGASPCAHERRGGCSEESEGSRPPEVDAEKRAEQRARPVGNSGKGTRRGCRGSGRGRGSGRRAGNGKKARSTGHLGRGAYFDEPPEGEIIPLGDEDAAPDHQAHWMIKIQFNHVWPNAFFTFTDGSRVVRMQATAKKAGDIETAARICRLCYLHLEKGASKEDTLDFRNMLYHRAKEAAALR
eukprot:TRINITY_DN26178_c0_g1_i1.p1 TRINITY_DN26178_c0_g1~~TRINITY_DN26178_c0_g1_i1.p1  ORF type:complete len:991 (-),score=178.51 TRINITY_DN26178_c0_g1_i1:76-3024(-)